VSDGLPGYSIVSPVRDEAQWLAQTGQSLALQHHRPAEWIIVDNGSKDETLTIARELAAAHDWIHVLEVPAPTERARGGPIVRAFHAGLGELTEDVRFVVKLDGDLFVPAHYFAWVAQVFASDSRAGIVGGRLLIWDGSRWIEDEVGAHTVHGAIKSYDLACLREIGGLEESMGWDGIDEYAARARGWRIVVLSELQVLHYKRRGSRQSSSRARWEEGIGMGFQGYTPAFAAVRAAYRGVFEPPRLLSGVLMYAAYAYRTARYGVGVRDAAAVRELRSEQRRRVRGLLRSSMRTMVPAQGLGPAHWTAERARLELSGADAERQSVA
jgi:hypothetical protein